MDAYVYQASFVCVPCGRDIKARLGKNSDTGDSNTYPQGPYGEGGGEADSPQHCDCCNEFLENPLTNDGYDAVREAITEDARAGRTDSIACTIWADFYDA